MKKTDPHTRAIRDAFQFFTANAGWIVGEKAKGALALAKAEARAKAEGATFTWEIDDIDSRDFSDEEPAWQLWVCVARDERGETFASLCGVDFGREGHPHRDPYARVVEAELALQMPEPEDEQPAPLIGLITITVEGGNVSDVSGVPAGVIVRVIDYDNDEDKDDTGEPCSIAFYHGPDAAAALDPHNVTAAVLRAQAGLGKGEA